MVITVTLNPLLERRVYFNKITPGKVNRGLSEEYKAGGKGINVARQLNKLGTDTTAFTFAGGHSGKIFRRILQEESINSVIVPVKNETRSGFLAVDEDSGSLTSYFGPNTDVSAQEAGSIKEKLEKVVKNATTVVLAGSSTGTETDDIFPYAVDLCHRYDKTVVLDTYGPHLKECLDLKPTVVHNNVHELESSLGIELPDEKSKIDFLRELYSKDIRLAFITDGPSDVYASKFDFIYKARLPEIKEIDATGSGDAFTAGIIYGLEEALVFTDFTKIACALGAANAATWDTCSVSPEDYRGYLNRITVEPVGKKMKLIDDSPDR